MVLPWDPFAQVSRLRKKLSVFDLQRKHLAILNELERCKASLTVVVEKLRTHEPDYQLQLQSSNVAPSSSSPPSSSLSKKRSRLSLS